MYVIIYVMDKLTLKQEMFCKEYIIDFNGKQAAIRAGYSKNSASEIASENLTKPNVQIFLKTIMKDKAKKLEINQDYVLQNIIAVQQRCMQAKPVMYFDKVEKEYKQKEEWVVDEETGKEKLLGVYTFDAGNANKSLDMLAKYTGFYERDNTQKSIPEVKVTLQPIKRV